MRHIRLHASMKWKKRHRTQRVGVVVVVDDDDDDDDTLVTKEAVVGAVDAASPSLCIGWEVTVPATIEVTAIGLLPAPATPTMLPLNSMSCLASTTEQSQSLSFAGAEMFFPKRT
jgi:hypothetical protein